jgi:prepilin-type N-terminal cleavage/methylation domain-containing protein
MKIVWKLPRKSSIKFGFTLIELLLTVSIVTLLAVPVASVGTSFLTRNDLQNNVNEVVSALRTAQINSMSGKEDSTWGVAVTGTEIVKFMGANYASRDPNYDVKFTIPQKITISSFELVFDKLTGNPSSTQIITLGNEIGESHTVMVNEVGVVDVN